MAARVRIMRSLTVLLTAIVLVAALPLACAPALGEGHALTGTIWSPAVKEPRTWEFPYDDAFFMSPETEYNHQLAQASLGMALSAFRDKDAHTTDKGEAVSAYLTQAGFTDLRQEEYDVKPSIDTIATMIGSKALNGFTVIAVAVCGGNYKDEWLSNFYIGNDERHAGFDSAAKKVQARIRAYIEDNKISSPLKLWISGYSRGAAVSNLTAADMIDSGIFESVYAYTFATPRNTKGGGDYKSIFNIIGKFDPVPSIPFPEWGFKRYGNDLYTPAQETDSDYRQKKAKASAASEAFTGMPFWNNVDANVNIKTIIDYLFGILPTTEIYESKMRPIINSVWKDRSLPNLSGSLVKLMDDAELLDNNQKNEMEMLLDYLSMTTYTTVMGQTGWNAKTTMLDNLAHEHSPDVYVAWMFSADDAKSLFTDKLDYLRVSYQGGAKISLIDNEGHFVLAVDENGVTSDWSDIKEFMETAQPLDERPLISVQRKGTQTIFTLPKDELYVIFIVASKTEMLTYTPTLYTVGKTRGRLDDIHMQNMKEGDVYTSLSLTEDTGTGEKLLYGESDISFSPWAEELPYSPSVIMLTENRNQFHLTFKQTIWLLAAIVVLLIAVITLVTVLLVKRHRKKKEAKEIIKEEKQDATDRHTTQAE